jgi:riboflavin kinase/FMN adenylyltransferase
MNTLMSPEELEARLHYLEEINRFTIDALEMAASLGDFQRSLHRLQKPSAILEETTSRAKRLIPFQAMALYLVDDTDSNFNLAHAEPASQMDAIREEVEFLIENGTFAWALREQRAVMVSSKDFQRQLVLHVLATHARIRGMFVGILNLEEKNIPGVSISLLSIILQNSANTLESFELYRMVQKARDELENRVKERTLELAETNKKLELEVAQRRRAEEAVRIEQDSRERVARSIGAGLCMVSRDYRVFWTNDILRQRWGVMNGQLCYAAFEQRTEICPQCGARDIFELGKEEAIYEQERKPLLITPLEEKLRLIEDQGMDITICANFSGDFADQTPEDFVKKILYDQIKIRQLFVGHDYTFGKDRQGNIALLKEFGRKLGFNVEVVEAVRVGGMVVSSTLVRELIQKGELREAAKLLGRNYLLIGQVIHGHGRGSKNLGFPTANLKPAGALFPKPGIYAVFAIYEGKRYEGVANLGWNPTFHDQKFSIEVHILNFHQDIHGHRLQVEFVERLRDEVAFCGPEELIAQIKKDIAQAKKLLPAADPGA